MNQITKLGYRLSEDKSTEGIVIFEKPDPDAHAVHMIEINAVKQTVNSWYRDGINNCYAAPMTSKELHAFRLKLNDMIIDIEEKEGSEEEMNKLSFYEEEE